MKDPKHDDLRSLIEQDFPKLAQQIAEDALSKVTGDVDSTKLRFNKEWCDYKQGMYFEGVQRGGDGKGDIYAYNPYCTYPTRWCSGPGYRQSGARIIFYNPRLLEISDVEVGDLRVLNPNNENATMTVDSYRNDTATHYNKKVDTETEHEDEQTHSVGLEISQEFRVKMSRSAGVNIDIFSANADMEVELTSRVEARTDDEWRKSDKLRNAVEETYTVNPYTTWKLTVQKSEKEIEQDVYITGLLDCSVWVVFSGWADCNFKSLDNFIDVVRGVKAQNDPIGYYFRQNPLPDEVVDAWHRPTLTLNCPIHGKRTRYSNTLSTQTPIKGREKELKKLHKKQKAEANNK